jgi:hypothetical protein
MEAVREGRSYIVRIPVESGDGRVVIALDAQEAQELGRLLSEAGGP